MEDWQGVKLLPDDWLLSNFTINIIGLKKVHFQNGMKQFEIMFTVTRHDDSPLSIANYRYSASIIDTIIKSFPDCYISPIKRSLAKSYLQQYASMKYLQATHLLPVKNFYYYHGFEVIEGKLEYLSATHDDCQCEYSIPKIAESEMHDVCKTGLHILDIGKKIIGENGEIDFYSSNKISLPFWLYLHFGFSIKLFQDAGIGNELLLILQGEKESLKTSMAEALALPFNPDCILRFESTPAFIEKICELSVDMNMVCDDIFKITKDFKDKFEFIDRTFGDGIGRGKTINQGKEVVKTKVRGGCIVTSEHILNHQASSTVRCLHLFLEKTSIDEKVLKEFQNDNSNARRFEKLSKLQKYFAAWIQRVAYIYNNKLQEITNFKNDEAEKIANLSSKRYKRILKIFLILVDQIIDWYEEVGVISPDFKTNLKSNCIKIIVDVMRQNDELVNELEPWQQFLTTLQRTIADGNIIIASNKAKYEDNGKSYIGYDSDDHSQYIISPSKIMHFVESKLRKVGKTFNKTQILKKLYEEGISKGYIHKDERGGERTRYLQRIQLNGHLVEMLRIDKNAMENSIKKFKEDR